MSLLFSARIPRLLPSRLSSVALPSELCFTESAQLLARSRFSTRLLARIAAFSDSPVRPRRRPAAAVDHLAAERLPRRRGEVALDAPARPRGQVLVVLPVPQPGQLAVVGGRAGRGPPPGPPGGRGSTSARGSPAIRAEPRPERPRAAVVELGRPGGRRPSAPPAPGRRGRPPAPRSGPATRRSSGP